MIQIDDPKLEHIINCIKTKIENRLFDENDIIVFLICIRELLPNDNELQCIRSLADLIAHRVRDRSDMYNSIKSAIDNQYKTYPMSNVLVGFNGTTYDSYRKGWKKISDILDIQLTDKCIDEIMLCVFSLAQFCRIEDGSTVSAFVKLVISKDKLALCLTEGKNDSNYAVFSLLPYKGINQILYQNSWGIITDVVETCREGGRLRLISNKGYII